MSLLPYRKGNKTKFTNLLFPLIPGIRSQKAIPSLKPRLFRPLMSWVLFLLVA